jgi:hypothetical protein
MSDCRAKSVCLIAEWLDCMYIVLQGRSSRMEAADKTLLEFAAAKLGINLSFMDEAKKGTAKPWQQGNSG